MLRVWGFNCRDVKPENLLLQPGREGREPSVHLRLIDFGSAIDAHSVRQLYGAQGPSVNEQTQEYAPPEALLGRCVHLLITDFPCLWCLLRYMNVWVAHSGHVRCTGTGLGSLCSSARGRMTCGAWQSPGWS